MSCLKPKRLGCVVGRGAEVGDSVGVGCGRWGKSRSISVSVVAEGCSLINHRTRCEYLLTQIQR